MPLHQSCLSQKKNPEETSLPNLSEWHLLPLLCLLIDSMATVSRKKKRLAGKEEADGGYVCVVTAKNDTV